MNKKEKKFLNELKKEKKKSLTEGCVKKRIKNLRMVLILYKLKNSE